MYNTGVRSAKMKKLIILSLCSLYCLILSGCGQNNNEDLNRFKQHLSKVETKQKRGKSDESIRAEPFK